MPGEPNDSHQQRAARTCTVLLELGAPVPKYYKVGTIDGGAYAVMSLMKVSPPGPEHFTPAQMEDLLRLVELQSGRALDLSNWPDALIERIFESDSNYTFPELMPSWSLESSRLLDRCTQIAEGSRGLGVRTTDIVHQDMNPSNIFVEGDHVSAIVDWENTTSGDRGWDVTEIFFCCWERPRLRELVLDHLHEVSPPASVALFAADMAVAFSSGAMAQGSSEWADPCVRVGNELLDVLRQ